MLYLTVLTEEVGEIAKAILDIRFGKDTLAHLREEAVQTAAVALAFVECLDRGKWKDAGGEPVAEADKASDPGLQEELGWPSVSEPANPNRGAPC